MAKQNATATRERQAEITLADFRIVVGWILADVYSWAGVPMNRPDAKLVRAYYNAGASANAAAKKIDEIWSV